MKIGNLLRSVGEILEADNPFAKKDDKEKDKTADSGDTKENPFAKKTDGEAKPEDGQSDQSGDAEKPAENGEKKENPFAKKAEGDNGNSGMPQAPKPGEGEQQPEGEVEGQEQPQQAQQPQNGGLNIEALAIALSKIRGEIERLEQSSGVANSPIAKARMELVRQRAEIEAKIDQLDQGVMPQQAQPQQPGQEQPQAQAQAQANGQAPANGQQNGPQGAQGQQAPKDGASQVQPTQQAQGQPGTNGSQQPVDSIQVMAQGNQPQGQAVQGQQPQQQPTQGNPAQPAGKVPEEVKQRFAAIKGPKKFDLNSNVVFYRDDTGKVFQAPADNAEQATEVTDQDLLSKLKF
jgi:23S rRNA pseudouridine2605 synthase